MEWLRVELLRGWEVDGEARWSGGSGERRGRPINELVEEKVE